MSARLTSLSRVAEAVLQNPEVLEELERLKIEIDRTQEPFIWHVIDVIRYELPENIRSGWIFVLKRNHSTGCHYHPNSIQHMLFVEGHGQAIIAGRTRPIVPLASSAHVRPGDWFVIDENDPHEFVIGPESGVVLSFHTCLAADLLEVDANEQRQRSYVK